MFISHNTESDTNAVNVLQFYFVDNSLYVSKEKSVFVENDSKRVTFSGYSKTIRGNVGYDVKHLI